MRTRLCLSFVMIIVLALALTGCGGTTEPTPTAAPISAAEPTDTPIAEQQAEEPVPPTAEPIGDEAYPLGTPTFVQPTYAYPDAEPTTAPARTVSWHPDGEIGPSEYARGASAESFAIWWNNDAEYLYMAVIGPGTGWVGVGLDPENRMQGANFIIGAVVYGEPVIWDALGMAPVGPNHPEDTELGGTMDVVDYIVTEQDDKTMVEFKIPLDSGDEYDKALVPGQTYPAIVACSDGDEFSSAHTTYDWFELVLEAAQ